MSSVTDAVREYILSKLTKAERGVADAQSAASPRPGYKGFDIALTTLRECTHAVSAEASRDSAAVLHLLDAARAALALTGGGAAGSSVREALKLLEEAAVIVRPTM